MITITCPGLDELTKTLQRQGKNLTKTYDEVLQDLVEEAKGVAEAEYALAEDYVHPDDYEKVAVRWEKIGECDYLLIAEGRQVVFYEFGAGYTTDSIYGFSRDMPFLVSPGSWSVKDKQQFTRYGRWYSPKGHYYNSIPPTRAMYYATQVILRKLEDGDIKL